MKRRDWMDEALDMVTPAQLREIKRKRAARRMKAKGPDPLNDPSRVYGWFTPRNAPLARRDGFKREREVLPLYGMVMMSKQRRKAKRK